MTRCSGLGMVCFWIGFVGMELTAPWYRFMAVSNGMHGPGVDWVVEEMSIVVSIQKGTVGIAVAPWLDFTHFKRRKRERLQLNGTG